jgi:hypothetical protein
MENIMRRVVLVVIATFLFGVDENAEARGRFRWRTHHSWQYELVPIKARRDEFLKVLNYCRQNYAFASDLNAEFSGHYGRHGWFCAYKR